jgi:hypothetical protein
MKKIILLLILATLSPLFAESVNYGDCVRSANKEYNEREASLLNTYRITIKAIELERSEHIKSHLTFFAIRSGLSKIQSVRNEYKMKISLAENDLKERLSALNKDYRVTIDLCQDEKKRMGSEEIL